MKRMSDQAVEAQTGKNWPRWFAILDKAGAARWGHAAIALWLREKHAVGDWWCQMVTVEYEKERGLRQLHQKADGFSISTSKTITAKTAAVFHAFHDGRTRARWLKESGLVVRKATPEKSMRVTWSDGVSGLEINFYSKGEAKSQVVVQHSKLPDAAAAASKKEFWTDRIGRLKQMLEG